MLQCCSVLQKLFWWSSSVHGQVSLALVCFFSPVHTCSLVDSFVSLCLCLLLNDPSTVQRTATHCNTLQHTAPHCNTLQHTATRCNTLQHTTKHCNTLQHTAERPLHSASSPQNILLNMHPPFCLPEFFPDGCYRI